MQLYYIFLSSNLRAATTCLYHNKKCNMWHTYSCRSVYCTQNTNHTDWENVAALHTNTYFVFNEKNTFNSWSFSNRSDEQLFDGLRVITDWTLLGELLGQLLACRWWNMNLNTLWMWLCVLSIYLLAAPMPITTDVK